MRNSSSILFHRKKHSNSPIVRTDTKFIVKSLDSKSNNQMELTREPLGPSKWHKFWTRFFSGLVMIVLFSILISAGHLAIIIMVMAIQTIVFKEVIGIAHYQYKEKRLPWFRTLNWYFLLCSYYYFYGSSLINVHQTSFFVNSFLLPFAVHHQFISFCLYIFGFVMFVLTLKKGYYKFQFNQFGLTHMTLLTVVCQSQFIIQNIMDGMIWFLLPVSLVIFNDITAYFCGFFFGRTPLIKLSPRKTWEGFLGAFVLTVIFGFIFSGLMARSQYLTCPVNSLKINAFSELHYTPNYVFTPTSFKLSPFFSGFFSLIFRERTKSITIYPVQLHAIVLAIFVSLIAPFGGFFASGFKRAFKIKDFASSIPGHGGMTDRMDCQFITGFFVHLYLSSFLTTNPLSVSHLMSLAINKLSTEDQKILYLKLQEYLINQDLINEPLNIVGMSFDEG